ncbi:MAG TPA: recombinase family protein [Mycobacteriales bacterium]|nr:recombinase family protein [Mycobacteriales bacterium]
MPTAAIYLRQSLDKTGERAAVRRQLEACKAVCTAKGWDIYGKLYEDNDTSASSTKKRKDYERLLADAKAGKFDAIVVFHLDRLCRRVRDLEDVLEVGLPIATAVGDMDLSTDMGRLVARILGAVAQGEVERKAARQRAGNLQRAQEGKPHAAPRAFGYRRVTERDEHGKVKSTKLVQEPAEAKAIRSGYRRFLAGASLRSIAAEWNAAGHLTSRGGSWTPYAVRDRLKNPIYAGIVEYNGDELGEGNWKRIVPEATYRAAKAKLSDEARKTTPGNARRYMMSGLARCGCVPKGKRKACGALMATGRASGTSIATTADGDKRKGNRTYQCSQHRHLSRHAAPIDDLIERLVIARLSRDDARDLLVDDAAPDVEELREEAQTLRARKQSLAVMLGRGAMDSAQFETANAEVQAALEAVENRMQTSHDAEVLRDLVVGDAAAVWRGLDIDRRRAVVDVLMTVTLLSPGKGKRTFDPETVRVEWRRPA